MALTCCCRARGQAAGAAPAGEPGRDFGDGATAPSFPRNIPVPAPGTQSAHPAPSQRGSRSRRARAPGMSEESARGAPRGEDLRWWERANGPPRGSLSFPGRSADARTIGKAFCCPGQLRTSPGGGCRSRPCSRCFRNEREEEVKLFFASLPSMAPVNPCWFSLSANPFSRAQRPLWIPRILISRPRWMLPLGIPAANTSHPSNAAPAPRCPPARPIWWHRW